MFRMALHAAADAAPERIERIRKRPVRPGHQRHHIGEHAVFRAMLCQNVIEVAALVVVEIGCIGTHLIKRARQLHHVIGVAGLAGLLRDVFRYGVRFLKILPVAVAADDI